MLSKKNNFLLFLILTIVSAIYGYFEILNFKPYGIHYWRQSDCISYAANYHDRNLPFLKPEIYWIGSTESARTVSEFPALYYLTAQIWKITGQHEIVLRMINIMLVFTGLFFLFKLFYGHTKSQFWSIVSVVLIFTSPILVFYTNNFLSDAPAFGLALIGLYFGWKYYNSYKVKYLYFTALFFLFAGLLKISSMIGLLAFIPIHIYLLFFDKERRVRLNSVFPFLIVFAGLWIWYSYAIQYNEENVGGVFLQGILPIWELDKQQVSEVFSLFRKSLIPAFFNKNALILMGNLLLIVLVLVKKTNKFLLSYFFILIAGITAYFFLFYQVFNVHDYYQLNMLVMIPAFLLLFIDLLSRSYSSVLNNKWLKIAILFFTTILIILTAQINRKKYFNAEKDFIVKHGIYNVDQVWEWHHQDYKRRFKALESIRPFLKEIGIKHDDKLISIPDPTPNFSLYLLGHKGWSDFGHPPEKHEENFYNYIKYGADYLVVNDTSIFSQRKFMGKYKENLVGNYENVYIYKLK
jgi:hypothetical protein